MEIVTILGSSESGRYFSLLFLAFQSKFSDSQLRKISKHMKANVRFLIKPLIITWIAGPSFAGENDVVSLVNCVWSSNFDVFLARTDWN